MTTNDTEHNALRIPNGKTKWDTFLDDEWPTHRKEVKDAMLKINEMHAGIAAIQRDTKHLPILDTVATTLIDIKDNLIEVLRGKNVVDVETVKDMLKAQQSTYTTTISTICKIFGLIIIILVGMKVLAPHWFGG